MRRRRRSVSRRRASPVRRSSRSLGGFVPPDTAMGVGATVAGLLLPDLISSKLPLGPSLATGWGRVAVQAGVVLGSGMLVKRFAEPRVAAWYVFGGLAGLVLPYVRSKLGVSGLAGLGAYGIADGIDSRHQLGQGLRLTDEAGTVYEFAPGVAA